MFVISFSDLLRVRSALFAVASLVGVLDGYFCSAVRCTCPVEPYLISPLKSRKIQYKLYDLHEHLYVILKMSCKSGDSYLDHAVNSWLKHDKVIFFFDENIFNASIIAFFSLKLLCLEPTLHTAKFRFIIV